MDNNNNFARSVGIGFRIWWSGLGQSRSPAADRGSRGLDPSAGPWTESITFPNGNKKEEVVYQPLLFF